MKPIANLIHATNVELAFQWYKRAFPQAIEKTSGDFTYLDVAGFALEIVHADEKVSAGRAGSVTYWAVNDLNSEISRFTALGSTVYRGPMLIEPGIGMCQVTDPSGNLIGLRGPFNPDQK